MTEQEKYEEIEFYLHCNRTGTFDLEINNGIVELIPHSYAESFGYDEEEEKEFYKEVQEEYDAL